MREVGGRQQWGKITVGKVREEGRGGKKGRGGSIEQDVFAV